MSQSHEGKRVPNVTFRTRVGGEWRNITTDEIFKGKNVVVFSLPGAFTPTCSSTHVPGYNELAPAFFANGIDSIVCISVNDAFVMNEWAADQGAGNILFLPDGNGEFTAGMGQLVDKGELGFGKRSWRYSMLVRDGVVEKMFVEPQLSGDPFEVSDAETMLRHLRPNHTGPGAILMLAREGCPHCRRAKQLLTDRGLAFEAVHVGDELSMRGVAAASGKAQVPQVFVDGKLIGGADQLAQYLERPAV